MYEWRKMSAEEREEALALRRKKQVPWHSPPHQDRGEGAYHLSATCYEHKPFIGVSPERMVECELRLLETVREKAQGLFAWCVLPNHYHLLVHTDDVLGLLAEIGEFHGRQSYQWNGEDNARGRSVWRNCVDRKIRSERHFWATTNYVHHNPVHHGYVQQWQDWPFGSARDFVERVGRDEAERIWRTYPILDYGKGWDEPEM